MKRVLNVAAYRFAALPDAPAMRQRILAACEERALRGTVLLAEEGINLVLAGEPAPVRDFLAWLATDPRLGDLPVRESWSDEPPFARLRVRLKREIIRMDCPTVRPGAGRAPSVDAPTLSRWLAAGHDDSGRPVVMLDTRNAFEVDHGAFAGAIDWRLRRFGDFPAALAAHRDDLRDQTVVAYCTGGIRCEKATILMQQAGLDHVHQLDGGILGYFEQLGGAPHWQGECFVFDERVALRPDLGASTARAATTG